MKFEQGGANDTGSFNFVTKKALRDAVDNRPQDVHLYSTSMFGGFTGDAVDLPQDVIFNVVGPDPYNSRKWYASVYRDANGKVRVK